MPTDDEILDRKVSSTQEEFEAAFNRKYAVQLEQAKEACNLYKKAYEDGKITLDPCGHSDLGKWEVERVFDPFNFRNFLNPAGAQRFIDVFNEPLEGKNYDGNDRSDFKNMWIKLTDNSDCRKCGRPVSWMTNGKVIRQVVTTYNHKAGFLTRDDGLCSMQDEEIALTETITVPSGKLVIGNDIRHIFTDEIMFKDSSERYGREFDINNLAGTIRYMHRYAENGVLTGFVGNCSLHVFASPDSIIITYSGEDDRKTFKHNGIVHKLVVDISCGLWWYGASDYDRCASINKDQLEATVKKGNRVDTNDLKVIKVNPGEWKMTHLYQTVERTDEGYEIVSRLERIK